MNKLEFNKAEFILNLTDNHIHCKIGEDIYFEVYRNDSLYKNLIIKFDKGFIYEVAKIGDKLKSIALIKDYECVSLKKAHEIYLRLF